MRGEKFKCTAGVEVNIRREKRQKGTKQKVRVCLGGEAKAVEKR